MAAYFQHQMQMQMAAMQQSQFGEQQHTLHPYLHYPPPALSLQHATNQHFMPPPKQPAASTEKGSRSESKRHKDKQQKNERAKRKEKKRSKHSTSHTQRSISPESSSITAATQPPYATADPFHHPFAARRSHHSSRGRETERGRGDVVMETNLEDLYAIPPLPDEVAHMPTASQRAEKDHAIYGKEEKQELSGMDDSTVDRPRLDMISDRQTESTSSTTSIGAVQLCNSAVVEEQKVLLTITDSSRERDSESGAQEMRDVRVLAGQAKDKEGHH